MFNKHAEENTRKAIALTIKNHKADVIALLQQNGVAINDSANSDTVIAAVFEGIKVSKGFRRGLKDLLVKHANNGRFNNFLNATYTDHIITDSEIDSHINSVTGGAGTTTSSSGTSTSTKSNLLGTIFNQDNINKLFSTGLDVLNTKLTSKATNSAADKALAIEQEKTKQLMLAAGAGGVGAGVRTGLSTGAKVAIGVGALGVIGLVTWLIIRKKKK